VNGVVQVSVGRKAETSKLGGIVAMVSCWPRAPVASTQVSLFQSTTSSVMASHQIAIAKASFAAGLLRPDPTSVSRDDIATFHALLSSVVTECSPTNIQV
jgi:hypothetical protein